MRQVTIILYSFSELSKAGKLKAIKDERKRFKDYFLLDSHDPNENENDDNVIERINRYQYEFKADGTRY